MAFVEWTIWGIMSALTITLAVLWVKRVKGVERDESNDGLGIAIICAAPRLVITWGIVLIAFIFMDLNKLHLLWIFPLIFLLFFNLRVILQIKKDTKSSKRSSRKV